MVGHYQDRERMDFGLQRICSILCNCFSFHGSPKAALSRRPSRAYDSIILDVRHFRGLLDEHLGA